MIELGDQRMMYQDSLIFFRNRPVYVIKIVDHNKAYVFDLKDQREKVVKWDSDKAAPPARRLGMVNTPYGAVYGIRNPVRRYSVGFRHSVDVKNVDAKYLQNAYYKNGAEATKAIDYFRELKGTGLLDSLYNVYPTFEEAYDRVMELPNPVAFDKQFAVDGQGFIFYKFVSVGRVYSKKIKDIKFNEGAEYLFTLLEDNWKKQTTKAS